MAKSQGLPFIAISPGPIAKRKWQPLLIVIARQRRVNDVDRGVNVDWVAKLGAIVQHRPSINTANPLRRQPELVEDVYAGVPMLLEVGFENFLHRLAEHLGRQA